MERLRGTRTTRTTALRALAILAITVTLGGAPADPAKPSLSANPGTLHDVCLNGLHEGITFDLPPTIAVGASLFGGGVTLTSTHVKMTGDEVRSIDGSVGEPISFYFNSDAFPIDAVVVTSSQTAQTLPFDGTTVGWFTTSSYSGDVPQAISNVTFCDAPDGTIYQDPAPPADPPSDPPPNAPPADPAMDPLAALPLTVSPADQPEAFPQSDDPAPDPSPVGTGGEPDNDGLGDDPSGDDPTGSDPGPTDPANDDPANDTPIGTDPPADDTTGGDPSGVPPVDPPVEDEPDTPSAHDPGSGFGDGTGGPLAVQSGYDGPTSDPDDAPGADDLGDATVRGDSGQVPTGDGGDPADRRTTKTAPNALLVTTLPNTGAGTAGATGGVPDSAGHQPPIALALVALAVGLAAVRRSPAPRSR